MRRYVRKPGARVYRTNYSDDELKKAIAAVKKGISYADAAKEFNVPVGTLWRKVKDLPTKKPGAPRQLSEKCEKSIVAVINQLTDWKAPLDKYEIRLLVKCTWTREVLLTLSLRTICQALIG